MEPARRLVISERPVHPALVSEADFVAVQAIRAARDGADPDRRYLLAGLLRCGLCGRRLESCWANNRAAYLCRHGHTSAAHRDPQRPKNLYVREDHLLAHLPAVYLLLITDTDRAARTMAPPSPAEVIAYLRVHQVDLVYDSVGRTLRADTPDAVKVTLDRRAG